MSTQTSASGPQAVGAYLAALRSAGFSGDIADDQASRVVYATDNSIYQLMPQAIIYPANAADIALAMRVADSDRHSGLSFQPRGGGTSCNGQSLGHGIVIDCSRHMRQISDFDPVARTIRVQPGVIRDQLNDYLRPHGLFFPPHVSTTNRATIGGMVSNDSSGKGSRIYGKTSAWVESLGLVLADGREIEVSATDCPQDLRRSLWDILHPHRAGIRQAFPKLNRGFSGYDLLNALNDQGLVNLPSLICGSEGTLALITTITCRVEPIPAHTAVVAVGYDSLDAALRAVPFLLESEPSAIEFIDDKILTLVRSSDYRDMANRLWGKGADPQALHFVEFQGDSRQQIAERLSRFHDALSSAGANHAGFLIATEAREAAEVDAIWSLRKACQGLLLKQQTRRRAQPFVEDFVVPPEALADFIDELQRDLRQDGVDVGMFGHSDVGVVHMRPLLDMTRPEDRARIRTISDRVFELTRRHGGLFWGEHGKGFRGEYSAEVIGPNLVGVMDAIKTLFDPMNRLNPGKIASPAGHGPIPALDAPPMRGASDGAIRSDLLSGFDRAMHCNGNGNCFGLDRAAVLCPSYRATMDRRFSPKGRAELLREWLRLRSAGDQVGLRQLVPGLKQSMDQCLSCKACAGGGCPVRVDIPAMRSGFLEWYHESHPRPVSHRLLRHIETAAPIMAKLAPVLRPVMGNPLVKGTMSRVLKLCDLPLPHGRAFQRGLQRLGIKVLSAEQIISRMTGPSVVIVQDPFVPFYDAQVALDHAELLQRMGQQVFVLAYRPSGKVLHVSGYVQAFRKTAERMAQDLDALAGAGAELIGLDPATTLMFRDEYPHVLGRQPKWLVTTFPEWIERRAGCLPPVDHINREYSLALHCTERALTPESAEGWKVAFGKFGLELRIQDQGCCGMAGLFGHETRNQEVSSGLYERNWRELVEESGKNSLLATGFSCRCQAERLSGARPHHPVTVLLRAFESQQASANM